MKLGEASDTKEDKYCLSPLMRNQNNQTHRSRVEWWSPKPGKRDRWRVSDKEYKVSAMQDQQVLGVYYIA
jgi:hypothetical protein